MSCYKLVVLLLVVQVTLADYHYYATPLFKQTRTGKLEDEVQNDPNLPQKRLTLAINKFSNRMFNVMNEYKLDPETEHLPSHEDLVYSPISVFTSLSTLQLGCLSETKSELGTILSLTKINDTVVQEGLHSILSTYKRDNARVQVLNRVFLDHAWVPSNEYVNRIRDNLDGEVVQTHFSNATAASLFVNEHVSVVTNGVLDNVISVDGEGVTEAAQVIDGGIMVVSGLSFEGDWERPFTPLLTRPSQFTHEDGTISIVDMMHRDGVYMYAEIEELNATVLSINYNDHRYSFNVILPEEGTSIADLESNLETFPFIAVMSRLKKSYVQVSLPKFSVETTVDLIEPLEKLGVRRVFSEDGAQVGGIVEGGGYGVYLTNAVHKVVFDVREGGSRASTQNFIEAVPATARVLKPFNASRPFVFFVADSLLNSVLLVGRKAV